MPAILKTYTLGCKVNQYETEYVRQGLIGAGFVDAQAGQPADLCLVNTCTVTAEGDSKSRQVIRRLARENRGARIIVMGCYATRAPEEIAALPQVAEVVTDKRELPDLLGRFGVVDLPTGISRFADRSRAYVKVQDGCLLRCTYCIIPQVRPHVVSRPAEDIVAEVERLAANGYREIVLTGVHLGHYGVEKNRGKPKSQWLRLSHLLSMLCALPGEFRLRLSSIESTEVTRELIDCLADYSERICPHLHICLQSGADDVLRRMKRRWTARSFIDRCRLVSSRLPFPAFTTDVIVGFPGETEQHFQETCNAVREVGFSKIHIFPFSPRKGTPAAEMPGQVPAEVKRERHDRLAEIESELRRDYFRSLLGRRLEVLVEGADRQAPFRQSGTSCRYAPVELSAEEPLVGRLVKVVAQQVDGARLTAALA